MTPFTPHFDRASAAYDQKSRSGLWRRLRDDEFAAVFAAFALTAPAPSVRILDLGCGTGFYLENFQRRGFKNLKGVDASANMIAALRAKGLAGEQADIETYVNESRFDFVICAGALEFLLSPARFFSSVERLLDKNGRFILLYPRQNMWGRFYRLYHSGHGGRIRIFEDVEVQNMARAAGLAVIETKSIFPFSAVAVMARPLC